MQIVIKITMHMLLLLVVLPWQLLDAPVKKAHALRLLTHQYIVPECKARKVVVGRSFFMITCCYIFIQMLFSAFCSFKIRNVPKSVSEAKRIAFSFKVHIFVFNVSLFSTGTDDMLQL